ncbi:peptidylprolyl isomerase [Candidatus Shapirobacteria bacterium]|nr:MAG: peptidylprolyl isomerase [Candidatus Shapirobacteria bacterium]
MQNKKTISLGLVILFSSFFLSACNIWPKKKDISFPDSSSITNEPIQTQMIEEKNPIIGLTTKHGQIVIELFADKCPQTVKNFLDKAKSGFYDNLSFHRVIQGFMAQGGDPQGTGMGGGRQQSELNNIPFVRGSLGLARKADTKKYSNDSQFFICFTTEGCQHLTGEYVNFGQVISGLDVLDQIEQGDLILKLSSDTK